MVTHRSVYPLFCLTLLMLQGMVGLLPIHAQENIDGPYDGAVVVKEMTPKNILTTLFESSNWTEEKGVGWKPDLEERIRFTVSDDGLCYTTLDTVLYYQEEFTTNLEQIAVAIFSTHYWYEETMADCHACAPEMGAAEFVETTNGWVLLKFHKILGRFGSWGVSGDASLKQLGMDNPALVITSGFTGQGITESTSVYYDLDAYNEIVEIFKVEDEVVGPGGCEEECDEEWCSYYTNVVRDVITEQNIDPDSDYPNYNHLRVNITERTCQGEETKSTELYKFLNGRYVRVE